MTQTEFEAHVTRKRKALTSTARRILRTDDCEDAVQSAILSAWANLNQLKDPERFDAWLMQILRNQCYQFLRDKAKQRTAKDSLARQSAYPSDSTDLCDALDTLSENDRTLLLKHHVHGDSVTEMAKEAGTSEDVIKMRLYRARKRLRIALLALLLLLLMAGAAFSCVLHDVSWFLTSRQADPQPTPSPDDRSVFDCSYSGRLLNFEVNDAYWDLDRLELLFSYALSGTSDEILTVHSGNLGVDGRRHDHIWINDQILPVQEWAGGKPVYTYSLDSWRIGNRHLTSSEDYLPEGRSNSFFARLHLDSVDPTDLEVAASDNSVFLQCSILVCIYETGETVEEGTLSIRVKSPSLQTWRDAYETYHR